MDLQEIKRWLPELDKDSPRFPRMEWLIDEVDRLTAANAHLQQRLDAAEEALRVAQGDVARLKPHNELLHRRVRTVEAEYSALAGNAIAVGNTRNGLGIEIVQLKGQLTAANSRVERLREALGDIVGEIDAGTHGPASYAYDRAKEALADDAKEVTK